MDKEAFDALMKPEPSLPRVPITKWECLAIAAVALCVAIFACAGAYVGGIRSDNQVIIMDKAIENGIDFSISND